MPKKKTNEPQAEQSKRFKETARELGCNEDEKAFEHTFGKIVKPVKPMKDTKGKK